MTVNRRFARQPANPGEWVADAACRGLTDLFSITLAAHRSGRFAVQTSHARAVCMSCPVLAPCREWALSEPDPAYHMIAGGLDPYQRRQLRKNIA